MSDSRVAAGMDRLPWLSDEPVRKAAPVERRSWNLTVWAVAALVLVAGAFFWLGSRTPTKELPAASGPSGATVTVPAPKIIPAPAPPPEVRMAPQAQVAPAPQPEVRVIRVPEIRIVPAPAPKVSPAEVAKEFALPDVTEVTPTTTQTAVVAPKTVAKPAPLRPWPPRVVAGASGRLVQIGAYGSRIQAKRGWVAMVRAYPALKRLPAVVVVTRNSQRRPFYRFQIGTTSQAHSEILCQRMEKITLSCAVVGLPWKAKVER